MNYRTISLSVCSLALAIWSTTAFAIDDATEDMHDGTLVNISNDKLVMSVKQGKEVKEHSHTLAAGVKVTLDGKECKASDLKSGARIRVTTTVGDVKKVTNIEAIDKQELFANTHEGKFVSITSSKLVMTNKEGKEHSHKISSATIMTCDGTPCKGSDLKAGMKIRVTTKKSDKETVAYVEAIDKDPEFALSNK